MKRRVLFVSTLLAAMWSGVSAFADDKPADGAYYIENVGAARFMEGGNSWGTQASVSERGIEFTLTANDDETYTIKSGLGSGFLGTNGYIDSATADWTVAPVEDGMYTLACTIVSQDESGEDVSEVKYLAWSGEGTVLDLVDELPATSNGYFRFVTKDERIAALAEATKDAPVNATFLVGDPNFSRYESTAPWTIVASNNNLSGGNNINNCAESYHSTFSLTQTVTVPAGVYALTAQGFYRQDGTDTENLPYFFIGEEKVTFPVKEGVENSMSDASVSFTNGLYTTNPIYVYVGEEGTVELGAMNEANTMLWCIWDNFQLTYYGANADDLNTLKFAGYVSQVETLRATATDYLAADISGVVKTALETALAETETIEGNEDAYKAAVATLTDATAAAKKSAEQKVAIDARYALLNSTNVYTAEAYATFKDAADDYLAKWEAGELTETVVNPNSVQGWHAANDYDDFLLSAWGTKDFESDLYINTWSVEGETDGSDFKVPFFEYWTADANSLAATVKTATVVGLESDKLYSVSALVRVRAKNGVTDAPTGITLSVGDGTPVDVTKGAQVGDSQMYLVNAVANGRTDAEGNLTISFNVAEDNNISWLSFKNVNYSEYYVPSNLDFAVGTPVDNGICTYEKDMANNNTTYSRMLEVDGWDIAVENGDARAAGLFAYGSENWLGGTGYNAPATNPEGEATGNALGVIGVWGASAQYTQKVTLPAGNYVLTIPVYNVGGTAATVKNLVGFIAADGTEYLASNKVYAVGEWTNEIVQFTLTEQTDGVLSLGFTAPNSGSAACQHLFYDKVEIETVSEADLIRVQLVSDIAAANRVVEKKTNVGDALFMIPTAALDTYSAAVVEAQAVADNTEATEAELAAAIDALAAATEAYNATPVTAPKADAEYTIKQNASGNYMTLANDKVTVEAEAAPLKFEAVGDGTYYILDADGEYAGYAGTDKWTMSATADKKAAWTIASIGDGMYTIQGVNGVIATDNLDAGSACYGDKAASNENAAWIIEEIRSEENHVYVINVDVEREAKLGYTNQTATVDIAAICEMLGVDAVTADNVRGVDPDGTYVENAMSLYDGWRNVDGAFVAWGNDASVCVKLDVAVAEDNIDICTYANNLENEPAVGSVYTAVWAVVTETDTVLINTNITFIEPVVKSFEIVKTITVEHSEEAGTAYSGTTATFDVNEVTEALGIESIAEAEQYIVNVTTNDFVGNTSDGWRDAAGDAALWGSGEGMVCVKIQDPASGIIDYIGCIDETYEAGQTYTAKWGFVYDNKAVVIDVVITFVVPVGIEGVAADNIVKTQYFGMNGAALDTPQKGINIVKITLTDGKVVTKKVLVK
ncbi:MAG: hypothetical protein NC206_00180 [Bacteroides sp.]|nr:hypothetical protein [Roseburia sp.]MCM1345493.1 hypothetical protein [Bacteroides sp.]MCM1420002.1 hypothetical protein [Bacteroides sp.]